MVSLFLPARRWCTSCWITGIRFGDKPTSGRSKMAPRVDSVLHCVSVTELLPGRSEFNSTECFLDELWTSSVENESFLECVCRSKMTPLGNPPLVWWRRSTEIREGGERERKRQVVGCVKCDFTKFDPFGAYFLDSVSHGRRYFFFSAAIDIQHEKIYASKLYTIPGLLLLI